MPSTKLHLSKAKRHQRIVIGQDSNKNDTRDYEQTHLDGKFYTKSKPKEAQDSDTRNATLAIRCMRTRNSNFPNNSNITISRRRNRGRAPNVVEPELRTIVEVAPMVERTMEELLRASTEGYGEAIILPEINAYHFEIKTNLLQLVQANPFHGYERENPHAHINSFKRITSTLQFKDVPNDVIKLMMFPYSLEGAAKVWENDSKTDERIDKLADQLSTLVEIVSKKVVTPAPVKVVTPAPTTDNNQASVCATTGTYNQVNPLNRVSNKMAPPGFAQGVAYEGPSIPTNPKKVVERETKETTDKEQSNFQGSTAQIPPSVTPIPILEPDVPNTLPKTTPIPEPECPKTEFAPTIKSLLMNKEKLLELAKIPLNENCSAMLLKKLLEKLGDPGKFLIPFYEEYAPKLLGISNSSGGNPTPTSEPFTSEFILEEIKAYLKDDSISLEIVHCRFVIRRKFKSQRRVNPIIHEVIKKEVLKLLDAGMIYPISDSPWVSPVHYVPKKGGITVVANEENELIPTRLVTGWRVCIDYRKLNEATRKDHFPLPFMDQMIERLAGNEFYCFLDGFSGEGIVLGHKISKSGIEVDHAKVDVIAKLPHPTTVKGVRSFLGHAGFYRRFIQDFSKIARPMTHLLEKETPFVFSKDCIDAFQTLKKKLTEAPILVVPDWNLPFELMCDASDFAIGAVLGQRRSKHFQPIHYASKTMTEAQIHYTTTEKEMLAVVYAFEKFRPYLVLSNCIV
ncbi:reverse transcriptase domain-containing protein [Tanacetum coccineum]